MRTWIVVTVASAVVGTAYLLGRRDGAVDAAASAALREARAVLETGRVYRTRLTDLQAAASRDAARVDTLTGTVARQRAELAALRDRLKTHSTPAQTSPIATVAHDLGLTPTADERWATDSVGVRRLALTAWRSDVLLPAVEVFAAQLDSLVGALQRERETLHVRAALSEARVAQLEPALQRLVASRTCRVLFFPCPSRTTTFVAGAAIGVALTLAVSH